MDGILAKNHYRRLFFLVTILILVIMSIIRLYIIPHYDLSLELKSLKYVTILIDNFIATLVVTIFLGSFLFLVTPVVVKRSILEVLDPKEISPLLQKAVIDTQTWIYKGSCGRYTRSVTLPKLAEQARSKGIGKDIKIVLLNPANSKICEAYATYRRSLKSANVQKPWNLSKVQVESLATIITALRFKHDEPLLSIQISLIDVFSVFRFDISDHYAIVTKEDKYASGIKADQKTYFYESYIDDVRLSQSQSNLITFNKKVPNDDELTEDNLKTIVKDLALFDQTGIEIIDYKALLNAIKKTENRYK